MNSTMILKTKPVSVNSLYRGRRFLTKEGKATKEAMSWEIKLLWGMKIKPIEGDVKVAIDFYFKDNRMDIDNALKNILDCMAGIVYKNDRQIVELHARKYIDKEKPSIVINIQS